MKFFLIFITNVCNFKCEYCCTSKTTNVVDQEFLDLPLLLKYMDEHCKNPEEWFIQISGGEPTLHWDLEWFLDELTNRGFRGNIFTNGSNKIKKSKSFIFSTTWHLEWGKTVPRFYDHINILQNPNDPDFEWKKEYCRDKRISYCCPPLEDMEYNISKNVIWNAQLQLYRNIFHSVTSMLICRTNGDLYGCHGCSKLPGADVKHVSFGNIQNRFKFKMVIPCHDCPMANGARDLSDIWKNIKAL